MLKETRRKEITFYSYTCVAKAKADNSTSELIFNLVNC